MTSTDDARSSSVAIQFLHRFLRDRDEGLTRTLAEYQALFPTNPAVIAEEYGALTAPGATASGDDLLAYPAQGDRYREPRTIGRGGMGTVLRVFDPSLERYVAMKRLSGKDGKLPDAQTLRRFLDEAKVTGQLQHPGIVTVFEIGLDTEHRPYFTMPLIEGRSLHEVIAAMHEGEGEWSQVRVLDILVRVCEAVAYAHDRGVVHRDLKPSNVMIGQFGETHVVDWGLARVADRPHQQDPLAKPDDQADDGATGTSDTPLRTLAGDVIGTPAYMAPEQARGDLDAVGKASDIYSLGAMLYHLLAGQPPYAEPGKHSTGRKTLTQALAGPPKPVATVAPAAPAELAAICERAMDPDPARRYGSVSDLRSDLRAFLENRVVDAYAGGPFVRLRKWVRRNRALAAASMVAVLSLIGGTVWSEIQRITASANATLATGNARLAEENLDLAFAAGDELLGRFSYYGIQNEPGADPVRTLLAEKALAYYERFRELRGDDARVEKFVALALFRIAMLRAQVGDADQARTDWQVARAATAGLIAKTGPTEELRLRLAQIDIEQNIQMLQAGDPKAAVPGLERAAGIIAELRAANPESVGLVRSTFNITYNLALAMMATRNKQGALRYSEETLEAGRKLVAMMPTAAAALSQHGSALMLRGKLLWQLGRGDEAADSYTAALEAIEKGLASQPDDRGLHYRHGETLNHYAILLRESDPQAATDMFVRAVAVLRKLATAHPGVRNYHGSLGGALCNLGIMHSMRDDLAAALPVLNEANTEIRRALQIDPNASDYRDYRRINTAELAIALLETDRYAEAADAVRELMREQPDGSHWKAGQLLAACANACIADPAPTEAERASRLATYCGEAMDFLREAAKQGTIPEGALSKRPFDSVRDRADFKALIEQAGH